MVQRAIYKDMEGRQLPIPAIELLQLKLSHKCRKCKGKEADPTECVDWVFFFFSFDVKNWDSNAEPAQM